MPIWIIPQPPSATPAAAVDVAVGARDQVTAAINRLPIQFRKPRIEALLRALVGPVQRVENAFHQLFTERTIDTAIGAQLDAIGFIVGQPRNGYGDDDYRRLVRARIAVNRSRGTFDDLIGICKLVIDDDAATIIAVRSGTAAVRINIEDIATTDAVAGILIAFLRQSKAGGVRITLVSGSAPPGEWFTWGVAGLGFGNAGDPDSGGKWIRARQ